MWVYSEERLEKFINGKMAELAQLGVSHKRFCFSSLEDYLHSNTNKICGLFGLRRTGKSTMMYQAIESIGFSNAVFIQCTKNDSYVELENLLDSIPYKYVFIDEITKIDEFINLSSSLSDCYVDKKIVITGTDSASLLFAKESELYKRIELIHTTYVSFAEYNYLLGKNIEDYVKFGGTLTDGETIYNKGENLEEYTNTAIVSNICKSVENGKDEIAYRRLYDLYLSGALESAVNKVLEINAREFSLRVATGIFNTSHRLGSAKDLTLKNRNQIPADDRLRIARWKNHTEICQYIMKRINLGDSSMLDSSDIRLITNFLIKLDVLKELPSGEIYFTQPGMQYCLSEVLMDEILNSKEYQSLYPDTQLLLLDKIRQDSIGHILESIVRTDISKSPLFTKMQIGKFDTDGNGEFDLFIINPENHKALVYEIKRSFIVNENQYSNLIDSNLCKRFELAHKCEIVGKSVIYQGESISDMECGVSYCNISDFLLDLDSVSKTLENDGLNIESCYLGR